MIKMIKVCREIRKKLNIESKKVANDLNIHPPAYCGYETNRIIPSKNKETKILQYYANQLLINNNLNLTLREFRNLLKVPSNSLSNYLGFNLNDYLDRETMYIEDFPESMQIKIYEFLISSDLLKENKNEILDLMLGSNKKVNIDDPVCNPFIIGEYADKTPEDSLLQKELVYRFYKALDKDVVVRERLEYYLDTWNGPETAKRFDITRQAMNDTIIKARRLLKSLKYS
ncbi:MAG: helix-turn-helix transcriptional regulator [Candidatus Nanoarchaeia archaeon]|nr:helix-turn-helix transcriptional regulator [Candidatus Nanoarchaeia archaeon]